MFGNFVEFERLDMREWLRVGKAGDLVRVLRACPC